MLRSVCSFHPQLTKPVAARGVCWVLLQNVLTELLGLPEVKFRSHHPPSASLDHLAGDKAYEIPIVDFPIYIRVLSSQADEPCIHDHETVVPSLL